MNEHPEVRWQPPNERDLKRFPPRSPLCASFRAMLRDYADGDLPKGPRRSVEMHVHECRDCALALSRVEHETLRLRRALSGPQVTAPAGLRSRVLERILAGDEVVSAGTAAEPPRESRRGVPLPLAVALAAAAMVIGALLVLQPWSNGRSAPSVRVQSAQDTWFEEGAVARRLEAGEQLPPRGVVRVDHEGRAVLMLGDGGASAESRGREAALALGADSRLGWEEDMPVLQQGALAVRSGRLLQVGLSDGTRLELGRGQYHLDATGFMAFDSGLRSDPGALRLRLEVLGGDAARLTRPGSAPMEIGPGQVARYAGWSPVEIEPSMDADRAAMALRATGLKPAAPEPDARGLQGFVAEARGGLPVTAAHVRLRTPGSDTAHEVDTDASGRFRVPQDRDLGPGDYVLLAVDPPARDPDLGWMLPRPVGLVEREGTLEVAAVALRPVPPVMGSVRDPNYRWLPGAVILPCLVDELTGLLMPLDALATEAGVDGAFTVRGLPVDLAPYQALLLLVAHESGGVTVASIPVPELAGASGLRLDLVVARTTQPLEGLPAGQRVRVAERLGGQYGGTIVRLHEVDVDFAGRAQLFGSGGRLFQVRADDAWVPLVAPDGAQGPWSPAPERARAAPTLQRVPGLSPPGILASLGDRYAAGLPGPGGPRGTVAVLEEGSNRRVRGAEVFALAGEGRGLRLVGIAWPQPVPMASSDGATLLGIGPDGSLGVLEGEARTGSEDTLSLIAAGAVQVAAGLRPAPGTGSLPVRLVFTPEQGPFAETFAGAEFVRFAAATGEWTTGPLPAGKWKVALPDGSEREVTIAPGRVAVLR